MDNPIDLFLDLFAISACSWLLYCFFISFRIERFIVKRYEQETELLNSVFFQEHATFTKSIPDFFSSAIYTGHLIICMWGWRFFKNKKAYRDIKNPEHVSDHFTNKEIGLVKWFAISGIIVTIHVAAVFIFEFIWPGAFG
ncbi:MAG: hypothetical protein GY699_13315 [Desulfobacteraceae bacterium]|nr:hypothetical protein [Desulfobacteraceae bacterium]